MDEFIGFFSALWRDWLAQSPANRLAIAGTLMLPAAGWIWSTIRVGSKAQRISRLEGENASLIRERNAARKEAEEERLFAGQWMPERWLKAAARERRDGKEERAIDVLRIGFDNVALDMARVAAELAGHSLSLMVERDAAVVLDEAQRFARLAAVLDPSDREAARLLEEIMHTFADRGEAIPDEYLRQASFSSDPESSESLIRSIWERGRELSQKGQYRMAQRLFARGALVARRAGLFDSDWGFVVRLEEVQAESFNGNPAGALEKLRVLLEVQKHVQGTEHPNMLTALFLEAQVSSEMGDFFGALEKLQALLPVQERVQGAEHPNVLTTRFFETRLLSDLGHLSEALEKVRALLPVIERAQGPEHSNLLMARWLEGKILSDSGDAVRAHEKLQALLPVQERVQGAEHPDVLTTRFLEARLLCELGRFSEALEKVQLLLPVMEDVCGQEHPNVLGTRYLEAQVLSETGNPSKALERVRALLSVGQRLRGAEHPEVLSSRYLEAQILFGTRNFSEALQRLIELLPIQVRVQGADHQAVLRTRLLLAINRAKQGEVEAALGELREILPLLEAKLAPTHVNVRVARQMIEKYSGEIVPEI